MQLTEDKLPDDFLKHRMPGAPWLILRGRSSIDECDAALPEGALNLGRRQHGGGGTRPGGVFCAHCVVVSGLFFFFFDDSRVDTCCARRDHSLKFNENICSTSRLIKKYILI